MCGCQYTECVVGADLSKLMASFRLRKGTQGQDGLGAADLYVLAERQGFEPWMSFWPILTFQASAFDHSATAPHIAGGLPLTARQGFRKARVCARLSS